MPSLLARFAGQDLLTSPNKPNQMGSLAVEGTGVYFEGHFDNPSQFDGSRKLEVAVTYPDGSKRTIRRSFEMKLDHSMYPHNATLSYKSGSNAYAPVTQPALWTGNESFRWVWKSLMQSCYSDSRPKRWYQEQRMVKLGLPGVQRPRASGGGAYRYTGRLL
jgi:hypothetical protein